ncbi:MAG: hypothetical protein QOE66_952, partial [Chloroflexota bacterium]|nr:hypothetical protein [Chloroflexota bacterium]
GHPGGQFIELIRHREDAIEMGIEHRLQALALDTTGQAEQPPIDRPGAPRQQDDREQQDDDRAGQGDDERAEIRLRERV